MPENNKIPRHIFQPGAMSIIQMGEELIGHSSTALNELIKNSYDADALNARIYFHHEKELSKSFIIVSDNGSGMDAKTLFGDWLKPSVSSKRNIKRRSERYNRHYLGSKGIGRLASMALGRYITVISKKEKDSNYHWITIDRELFKEERLLAEINFPGADINDFFDLFNKKDLLETREVNFNSALNEILLSKHYGHFIEGTLIVIEFMDDSVHKILEDDFEKNELFESDNLKNTQYYKSLATLITPLKLNSEIQKELFAKGILEREHNIANEDSLFAIQYGSNKVPDQNNGIEWQDILPIPIQSAYDYRIYGKVTKSGNVDGFLSYQRISSDEKEEKIDISIEDIYDENELNTLFRDSWQNEAGEYYFDIRVYDIGDKEDNNLEKLAKLSGYKSGKDFKSAFKNFQGLRVSKNGFGVKPYGEEVEDWIELSKRRVQDPGGNVNTNQILGYVFFYSPENDKLEEKTNREGFLENKAFFQVKDTLVSIFKNLGRRRYLYRQINGLGRIPSSKHRRPNIEEFLSKINNNNNVDQIRAYSENFMKEVSTSLDNIEESLSFSERLASLGSGIELIYHEMAQPISSLRTTKSSLNLKRDKLPQEIINQYVFDLESIEDSTDLLVELRQSLQPAIGRTRAKNFKPYDTFKKVSKLFKSDLEEFNIKILADDRTKEIEIKEIEYAFWIAFLNILNNAVYWLKKSQKEEGEIRFHVENNSIVISNSGPIIKEELLDHIFEYGVTTRQEKNATGLGLAFTSSALNRNNWQITAENRKNGPAFIINKIANE